MWRIASKKTNGGRDLCLEIGKKVAVIEMRQSNVLQQYYDVIKWKHFQRYWPFVWGIHRSPVNFDVFFDLCLNKRLSRQSRRWWSETPSHSLSRHCNDLIICWWNQAKLVYLPKTDVVVTFCSEFVGARNSHLQCFKRILNRNNWWQIVNCYLQKWVHHNVIKWTQFPQYWPYAREFLGHRWFSHTNNQICGTFVFSLMPP